MPPEQRRLVVWMLHPLRANATGTAEEINAVIAGNIARAKRWMQWIIRTFPGVDVAADWILWSEVLDDLDPAERARGMRFGAEMISRMDEVWVVGGATSVGMTREIAVAMDCRKPVRDLTHLGAEPPAGYLVHDLPAGVVFP